MKLRRPRGILRLSQRAWLPLIPAFLTAFSSCGSGGEELVIVSYNVQNLFDSTEDGGEYAEFTRPSGYTPDRYFRRLASLAQTLRSCSERTPDFIVLQEIEGARAVADLLHDHLRTPRFHATVLPTPGMLGVAVLSRVPPKAVRTHQSITAILEPAAPSPVAADPGATRPMGSGGTFHLVHQSRHVVEVEVETAIGPISLFGCHWKSQSGGEQETEPNRVREAALIRTVASNLRTVASNLRSGRTSSQVLVIGDLNEDIEEYRQHNGLYLTALMPVNAADAEFGVADPRPIFVAANPREAAINGEVVLFSPWLAADAPEGGTYYHAGRWERLDQVLCGPAPAGVVQATIRTTGPGYLTDEAGEPVRYNPRTGRGYSDHLPVLITIGATHPSQ